MKVVWEGNHPDEGSIHAWLDGEIDGDEAARLDAHVRTCAECTAAVAEARGLIAGASRVVGMLDAEPPAHVRPAEVRSSDTTTAWRFLRVTPARSAIAAVLLVAIGITLTRKQGAFDAVAPSATPAVASVQADTASPIARDTLLSSAIAKRIAAEQPPRAVAAAPGPNVPVPAGGVARGANSPPLPPDAETRVAAGRASLRAQADTLSAVIPDRSAFSARVPGVAVAAAPAREIVAARAAEEAVAKTTNNAASVGLLANRCMRIENTSGSRAAWGGEDLPVTLVFDATGRVARVFSADGKATDASSVVLSSTPDSTVIRLRRIGYDGMLSVMGSADARAGVMRAGQSTLALSEVVVTGTGTSADARAALRTTARADSSATQRQAAIKAAPGAAADAPVSPSASRIPVAINTHFVTCPTG